MKELILIRHGEAEHLVRNLTGGWTRSTLTPKGIEQAIKVGKKLKKLIGDSSFVLYSSDFDRAAKTAEAISKILNCDIHYSKKLRDTNNGIAANLSMDKAKNLERPLTYPLIDWVPYEGAESWRQMHQRVTSFFDDIECGKDDIIICVTHSNPIVSIIHWWLELDEEGIMRVSFETDPCSITILNKNSWNNKTIVKLNDTSHLE